MRMPRMPHQAVLPLALAATAASVRHAHRVHLCHLRPAWRQVLPHPIESLLRFSGAANVANAADSLGFLVSQPAPQMQRLDADFLPLPERRIADAFKHAQRLRAQRIDREPETRNAGVPHGPTETSVDSLVAAVDGQDRRGDAGAFAI